MSSIQHIDDAIIRLEALLQKNNEHDEELITYIKQLAIENEQLKRSLHKLRTSKMAKLSSTGSMHSKLTDALRE